MTELPISAIVYFVASLTRCRSSISALDLLTDHNTDSFRPFTMTRTTRQGRVANPAAASTIGLTLKDQRAQKKVAKARKKHEKEQSKKERDGTNDRVSRARAIEIDALYDNEPMEVALPDKPSPRPTRRRIRLANPSCTDFGPLRNSQFNRPIAKWFFSVNAMHGTMTRMLCPRSSKHLVVINVLLDIPGGSIPLRFCQREAPDLGYNTLV